MPAFWKVGGIILLWLLTAYCSPLFAARSLSITSDKSSLFGGEEAIITASASGFTDGEIIYIKGALYQEGSTNYFGYTQKDSSWVKNGESTTNQRQASIGIWDGKLVVKSDFSDSGYKGEGEYRAKVGFYYLTSGGNVSSVNWSTNSLLMTLNEPDPTPTNSPTPTNTPTNSPQPTSIHTPIFTPKPTNTSSPKPTEKKTLTPTKNMSEMSTSSGQQGEEEDVLGAKADDTATSSVTMERVPSYKVFIITFLFIGIGSALLSLAFVLRKQFFSS